jgi:hypothetical protein
MLHLQLTTKQRLRATYVEPSIEASAEAARGADDLTLNRLAHPTISFEMHTENGMPRLTARYVSPTISASTTANITILYGERALLKGLVRQLPTGGLEPVPASDIRLMRCVTFVWSSENGGIGSAVIMVEDQMLALERLGCLSEAIGRALGIRGEVTDDVLSLFSTQQGATMATWTPFDSGVIAMLYDPQMRSGMRPDAVEQVARDLQPKYFGR